MPIHDINLSVHECVIKKCHFSKPMTSKSVIMVSSAFMAGEKMNILANKGNH